MQYIAKMCRGDNRTVAFAHSVEHVWLTTCDFVAQIGKQMTRP